MVVTEDVAKTVLSLHANQLGEPKGGEKPLQYYYDRAVYLASRVEEWTDCEFVPLEHIRHYSLARSNRSRNLVLSEFVEHRHDPGINESCITRHGWLNHRVRPAEKGLGPWFNRDELALIAQGIIMHDTARTEWEARKPIPDHAGIPPLYAVFSKNIAADPTYGPLQYRTVMAARRLRDIPHPWTLNPAAGTIRTIRLATDRGLICINFNETDHPGVVLPAAAVLRPGITIGAWVEAGAVIADPVQPGRYKDWEQLMLSAGRHSAELYLESVLQAAAVDALGGVAYPAELVSGVLDRFENGECYFVRRFSDPSHSFPQVVRCCDTLCGLTFVSPDGTPVDMVPRR